MVFRKAFISTADSVYYNSNGEAANRQPKIASGDLDYRVDTRRMFWEFKKHGENLNNISLGMSRAVDERMKSERFKTELITNVSHDIKTPLTSIINYVDLLNREDLPDGTIKEYVVCLCASLPALKAY